MYENFPPKDFKGMNQKKQEKKNFSPFLITKGLAHLTGLVKMNWDDEKLNLSDKQKEKLLKIRKETIKSIRSIKPKVMRLESKIVKLTNDGLEPKEIFKLTQKLSNLKHEATKTHIRCIYNTKKVLTKEQLIYLLK